METEYVIKISLTNHLHDNSENPYYWTLSKYDETWHQIALGWEKTPEQCFFSAQKYYHELILPI